MVAPSLNLDAVRAFVLIADLGSFTRAAETLGVSQSAVSLKLKRLEGVLGCRLVARTPRSVEMSPQGAAFLERARDLLTAHERACSVFSGERRRLTIGISDHVAGPELPTIISQISNQEPSLLVEVRIGSSGDLLQRYDRRELDTAIVRFRSDRGDGEVVAVEPYGWFAAEDWLHRAGDPLPIISMPEPCGVKLLAGEALDRANIAWTEVFVGGGVTTVSAAVVARLGVAALTRRMLPHGVKNVGPALGLPELPKLPIVMHTREREARALGALSVLSGVFRKLSAQ